MLTPLKWYALMTILRFCDSMENSDLKKHD